MEVALQVDLFVDMSVTPSEINKAPRMILCVGRRVYPQLMSDSNKQGNFKL